MNIGEIKSAVLSTKRVLKYANKYNTKVHILHISTKDEINLLKNTKSNITCRSHATTFKSFLSKMLF